MIYSIVRPLAKQALKVYFRKIYLTNASRIPRNKPVILACNHPTGFLEPCILACFLDRPLYFLVRGDFFANPVSAFLLRILHMLPVYRLKDGGYGKLKRNYTTFEACHQALYENRTIMIFAEGNTKYEMHLRPLQKGLARIAFGALEAFPDMEDVYIVPVGATYTRAHKFRSAVMIDCGEPLKTTDFQAPYDRSPADGIAALIDSLYSSMKRCMVHVEKDRDEILVDQLLEMDRSERPTPPFPRRSSDPRPLQREREIANMVNKMPEPEKADMEEKAYAYFDALKKWSLSDADLQTKPRLSFGERLLYWLGSIPAGTALVLNYPPILAIRWVVNTKVKSIEFYSPVLVSGGLGFYIFYLILLVLIAGFSWGWQAVAWVVLVPLSGWFLLRYLELWYKRRSERLLGRVPEEASARMQERREAIVQSMRARAGGLSEG